ncbi:hypothetical protein BU16DRAFT_443877, partial [Lophium mytilinum]
TRFVTRRSNRKGNTGRPYFKCLSCDRFLCFADRRGNDPSNPLCFCGASIKRQISGPEKDVARGVHFVCRLGECAFYRICVDANHQQCIVANGLL